jgi:hypothetical protein
MSRFKNLKMNRRTPLEEYAYKLWLKRESEIVAKIVAL